MLAISLVVVLLTLMKYFAPLYELRLQLSKDSVAESTSVLIIVAVLPDVPAVVLSPNANR